MNDDFPRYSAKLSAAEANEFVPFMHELIGKAFAVIRPFFLSGTAVATKDDATPVTLADRNAEHAMRALIERRYPDHGIIGEELGSKMETARGTSYRWILDPVDGTHAFITNCFLFGTLIALERNEGSGYRPILGAIAHPAAALALIGQHDRATLYAADGSARAARVRSCDRLANATLLASSHWSTREQAGSPTVEKLIQRARLYRTWGDCFGYFGLATGGADIMIDPTLAYWDVAAIVPIIEGAGGRVTSWRGGDPLASPSAIATAGPLHDEVLALLRETE